MKTKSNLKLVFAILLVMTILGCINNDNDLVEEPEVTKCFTVKVLDTDELVKNTSISFGRIDCSGGGCGFSEIISGHTDITGQVCVTMTLSDFENVAVISCSFNNSYLRGEFSLMSNTNLIYVDTWPL